MSRIRQWRDSHPRTIIYAGISYVGGFFSYLIATGRWWLLVGTVIGAFISSVISLSVGAWKRHRTEQRLVQPSYNDRRWSELEKVRVVALPRAQVEMDQIKERLRLAGFDPKDYPTVADSLADLIAAYRSATQGKPTRR